MVCLNPPPPPPPQCIRVKLLNEEGEGHEFEVEPKETLRRIRLEYAIKEHIQNISWMVLRFNGRVVDALEDTADSIGLKSGQCIEVSIDPVFDDSEEDVLKLTKEKFFKVALRTQDKNSERAYDIALSSPVKELMQRYCTDMGLPPDNTVFCVEHVLIPATMTVQQVINKFDIDTEDVDDDEKLFVIDVSVR
eukprot:m.177900 g.177900  ORF g.177900 m.177900 type:complete len:192 (-) comp21403_c5_seq1:68-643(-)